MEANKNNSANEQASAKQSQANEFAGFDFNKLLNDKSLEELLKHLLSGGGALAANYFMWIKPLQDKIESMNKQITEQENKIKDLQKEQEKMTEYHKKVDQENNMNGMQGDYFITRNRNPRSGNYQHQRVNL